MHEELADEVVGAKFASTKKYGRREGYTQEIEAFIYNLDVIISVGYRVKSARGVAFRQWLDSGLSVESLTAEIPLITKNQLEEQLK